MAEWQIFWRRGEAERHRHVPPRVTAERGSQYCPFGHRGEVTVAFKFSHSDVSRFALTATYTCRKTGIAPKANVLKDADDMDNVDDWFASSGTPLQ